MQTEVIEKPTEKADVEENNENLAVDEESKSLLADDRKKDQDNENKSLLSEEVNEKQKKTDDPEKDKKDDKEEKPIEYEEFKFPEGVQVDTEAMGKISDVFKDIKLSQENAQKLIDDVNPVLTEFYKNQFIEAHKNQWDEQLQQFQENVKKDPDLGGDKYQETMNKAKLVIKNDTLVNDGFREYLNKSRFLEHPEGIRFLNNIYNNFMADDKFHSGDIDKEPPQKSIADTLYDTIDINK